MKLNPKVSVIMSVYNDEKYVADAIRSILNQTYEDFEFIIVNDGSTDRTQEIIDSFKDDRLVKIRNERNSGVAKSINTALKVARGEFIAIQDSDDLSLNNRLKDMVNLLEKSPNMVALVVSLYIEVDEKGKVLGPVFFPTDFEVLRKNFIRKRSLRHPALLMKKKALEKVGFYNESYRSAEDYELWLRLLKDYEFKILPKVLTIIRKTYRTNERKEIYYSIKARLWALRNLDYPFYQYLYLIKPFLDLVLPNLIKRPIQHYILRSR